MPKRKLWLPVTVAIVLLLGVTLMPPLITMITNFPDSLFGQVVLAPETKPLSPRAYHSAEFVLNQVAHSEIEQGVFIVLHSDVLFWEPHYVGFARTALNDNEIQLFQQLLSAGNLFYPAPEGRAYQCVTGNPGQEPILEPCAAGNQLMDQYLASQWEAEQNRTVGVLQFFLTGGRLVEIRVYPSEQGLAYEPYEKGGDWWLNGLTDSSPLLEELAARASLPPIAVLWPAQTPEQAQARATRILGNRYQLALQIIQDSSEVREVFGPIQKIRPAIGKNFKLILDGFQLCVLYLSGHWYKGRRSRDPAGL